MKNARFNKSFSAKNIELKTAVIENIPVILNSQDNFIDFISISENKFSLPLDPHKSIKIPFILEDFSIQEWPLILPNTHVYPINNEG